MPLRHIPGTALAALGSLPFGAVLGPEGPLIALGGAAGTAVARLARRGRRETTLLSTAGAFSAISALFGGPLVASFMLIEAGASMAAALIPTLLPGLVAATIGYLIFVGVGDRGGVQASSLAVPGLPTYQGTSVRDLAIAIGVGIVAAAVVAAAARLGSAIEVQARGVGITGPPAHRRIVPRGARAPRPRARRRCGRRAVLRSGRTTRARRRYRNRCTRDADHRQVLGYAISLGCGFRGGAVFPAIFIGTAVAMIPAVLLQQSPTIAVAVGAAAGMGASSRLLFSSVLFRPCSSELVATTRSPLPYSDRSQAG